MRRSLLHALFPIVRAEILRLLLTDRGQELYVRQNGHCSPTSELNIQTRAV